MKSRGVKDVLISSIDGLPGFSDATKTVFPTDDSLVKILYLSTIGVTKKWTVPVRDWVLILGQLQIHFEDRL